MSITCFLRSPPRGYIKVSDSGFEILQVLVHTGTTNYALMTSSKVKTRNKPYLNRLQLRPSSLAVWPAVWNLKSEYGIFYSTLSADTFQIQRGPNYISQLWKHVFVLISVLLWLHCEFTLILSDVLWPVTNSDEPQSCGIQNPQNRIDAIITNW